MGRRAWDGRWGWVGSQRQVFPFIGTEKQPLFAHGSAERGTVYLSGREGCWKQFHTNCSLISASQWHCTPHSGLSRINRATNMIPVNANPAMCMLLCQWCFWIVLECGFHLQVWISALVLLCLVFENPFTEVFIL